MFHHQTTLKSLCLILYIFLYSSCHRIQSRFNIQGANRGQNTSGSRDKEGEGAKWGELPCEVFLGAQLCVHKRGSCRRSRTASLWAKWLYRWKCITEWLEGKDRPHSLCSWGITEIFWFLINYKGLRNLFTKLRRSSCLSFVTKNGQVYHTRII